MNISGENLIREGMMDKALDVFNQILCDDSQNFRAYNNLGLLAWYAGEDQLAWEHFTKSIEINPLYMDALINAFDASLKLKKIDDFRVYLDKVFEIDPQNKEAGKLLTQIIERSDSIYDVNNYDSIDEVQNHLLDAEHLLNEGKIDDATLLFLEAIEKKPDDFAAYNGLGIIANGRKMFKDADRLFNTAVELNPLNEDSLLNLWDNSLVLGNQETVIDRLQTAIQVDPGLKQVKAIVESYKQP
jgi:tetratricopeptide (TPR) repeat protein